MTPPSTSHNHAPRFKRSSKSALAVAALALVHAHATSQPVVSVQAGGGVTVDVVDPWNQGVAYVQFLRGSAVTGFGTGDYAVTGEPWDIGGALGAINVPRLQIGGLNGTTISEQFVVDEWGDTIRSGLTSSAGMTSLDIRANGPAAGTIESLNMAGTITMSGSRIVGAFDAKVLTGGALQISQIRVSPAAGQVVADLIGTRAAVGTKPAVAYNSPNTVMWTFDPVADVVAPPKLDVPSETLYSFSEEDAVAHLRAAGYTDVYSFDPFQNGYTPYHYYAFTAKTQISNLTLTSAGAAFLSNALGLLATGQDAMNAANNSPGKWGSINATLSFMLVPEPSTYALMGLGLVGITLAARRSKPHHPA